MPMKNPPHPGHGLGDDIEARGLSLGEAAKRLGITRQQLHNITSGKNGISTDMAVKLEQVVGSTAEHWLRLQLAYNLAKARQRKRTKRIYRKKT
jgi:addiction module HigA family antidote